MARSKRDERRQKEPLASEPPPTIKNLRWLIHGANWRSEWKTIVMGVLIIVLAPIMYHYLLRESPPRPVLTVTGQKLTLDKIFIPEIQEYLDDGVPIHNTYKLEFDVKNSGLVPALSVSSDSECQWFIELEELQALPAVPMKSARSAMDFAPNERQSLVAVVDRFHRDIPHPNWERTRCVVTVDFMDLEGRRHRKQTCWLTDDPPIHEGFSATLHQCPEKSTPVDMADF